MGREAGGCRRQKEIRRAFTEGRIIKGGRKEKEKKRMGENWSSLNKGKNRDPALELLERKTTQGREKQVQGEKEGEKSKSFSPNSKKRKSGSDKDQYERTKKISRENQPGRKKKQPLNKKKEERKGTRIGNSQFKKKGGYRAGARVKT